MPRTPLSELEAQKKQPERPQERQPQHSEITQTVEYDGVPIDLYRHFGVELDTATESIKSQLKRIHDIIRSRKEGFTIGDVLSAVNTLESRLGAPRLDEKRYVRVHRWLVLEAQKNELEKRQESLRNRMTL